MEPLAFIAAILGAGGLGAILKIVLSASNKTQNAAYRAMEEQRAGFEKFLGNHMSGITRSLENLVDASAKMSDRLVDQHEETRALILRQESRTRDAHRRLAIEMSHSRKTAATVGKALDKVLDENGV